MEKILDVNITSESILKQNEEENAPSTTKTVYDKNNYLNVTLNENENSKIVKIRLLPFTPTSKTPFKKIKVHTIKKNGTWHSYVCPNQTGLEGHERSRCPFCEVSKASYDLAEAETDEIKKKHYKDIAFENMAKESWIVRCIDRNDEAHGPKFWRFSASSKKHDGIYDKIINLFKVRLSEVKDFNLFDLNKGKDLIISITRGSDGKKVFSVTDAGLPTPLSDNFEQAKAWIDDTKCWSDVFGAVKSFEYLSIAMEGKTPHFNKETQQWEPMLSPEEYEAQKQKKAQEQAERVPNLTGKIGIVPTQPSIMQPEEIKSTTIDCTFSKSTVNEHPETNVGSESSDGLPF